VHSYSRPKGQHDFIFSKTLDYKLFGLLETYSVGKPVLIFCATRKGVSDLVVWTAMNCLCGWTRCIGNGAAFGERVRGGVRQTGKVALAASFDVSAIATILLRP
jgi:hypothetical protein